MIKFSIVIPMYNVAHYLDKCVNSVLDQNLKQGTFEVLMINDESPDNSLDVANRLADKYAFIKVISQKNKGLGGARNTGVSNASGKYIIFLDADDWLIPNSLESLVHICDTRELDILEFGAHLVSENEEILFTVSKNSDSKVYNGIEYYNTIKYSGSACNKMYRRDFLLEYKLVFLEKIYGEDFEFNTRSFYYAQRVLAINQVCAAFLQTSNSITRNNDKKKKDKYLNDFVIILSNISDFWKSVSDKVNDVAVSNFFTERLTMVNINAFYQMFKNNYSYKEIRDYKTKLKDKGLFYVDHSVAIKKKDLFRKIMLKNFFLFGLSQPIKKAIKK